MKTKKFTTLILSLVASLALVFGIATLIPSADTVTVAHAEEDPPVYDSTMFFQPGYTYVTTYGGTQSFDIGGNFKFYGIDCSELKYEDYNMNDSGNDLPSNFLHIYCFSFASTKSIDLYQLESGTYCFDFVSLNDKSYTKNTSAQDEKLEQIFEKYPIGTYTGDLDYKTINDFNEKEELESGDDGTLYTGNTYLRNGNKYSLKLHNEEDYSELSATSLGSMPILNFYYKGIKFNKINISISTTTVTISSFQYVAEEPETGYYRYVGSLGSSIPHSWFFDEPFIIEIKDMTENQYSTLSSTFIDRFPKMFNNITDNDYIESGYEYTFKEDINTGTFNQTTTNYNIPCKYKSATGDIDITGFSLGVLSSDIFSIGVNTEDTNYVIQSPLTSSQYRTFYFEDLDDYLCFDGDFVSFFKENTVKTLRQTPPEESESESESQSENQPESQSESQSGSSSNSTKKLLGLGGSLGGIVVICVIVIILMKKRR